MVTIHDAQIPTQANDLTPKTTTAPREMDDTSSSQTKRLTGYVNYKLLPTHKKKAADQNRGEEIETDLVSQLGIPCRVTGHDLTMKEWESIHMYMYNIHVHVQCKNILKSRI